MEIKQHLTLRNDVEVFPVADLDEETRRKLHCDDCHFAISVTRGRAPSKTFNAETAALLAHFTRPRKVVEAVILHARERGLDPREVLEQAYPLVRDLLDNRFLVPAFTPDDRRAVQPSFTRGHRVDGFEILRVVRVLDDTEIFQVRLNDGRVAALKIERAGSRETASLAVEARILRRLGGPPGPELLGEGTLEGRSYLLLEWIQGVESHRAAAEWQLRGDEEARRALLEISRAIVCAYERLEMEGVLHGDIHPRNVLVLADGSVRLVDMGLGWGASPGAAQDRGPRRGGMAFFFDPELARALLASDEPPPPSRGGEQYALAALLYFLVTGRQYIDFHLERERMLEQIVSAPPLAFEELGLPPWPELEGILRRALAKGAGARFPSIGALAAALGEVSYRSLQPEPAAPVDASWRLARSALAALAPADLGGRWLASGITPPPTASLYYGAAGVALALLGVASRRGDPRLLSLADLWIRRAEVGLEAARGFYSDELDLGRERVGEASPYHGPSGVAAVRAAIARARDDGQQLRRSARSFVRLAARRPQGLDLSFGRSGVVLFSALLLDLLPQDAVTERSRLLDHGRRNLAALWSAIHALPAIASSEMPNLGMAHGWAGFLYASLQWCRAAGDPPPAGLQARASELARLAEPFGRGLQWPWTLERRAVGPVAMPGWCNGSAGYVLLWSLAHRVLGGRRYLDLATGAAWDAWDSPQLTADLCCGLVGRAYALLNLYRANGECSWLRRACDLGERAARQGVFEDDRPHSLFKGELSLAVLAADLDLPDEAAFPLCEDEDRTGRA